MTPRSAPSPEDNSSPEDPHNPDSRHNRHKHGGAAPVTWRCTRYVALHPLRGGAPEQKRCIAYGSGAVPQHTRTNAELAHRTTHRHTPPCAPGPYWRQDGHAAHATHAATCTPAHSNTSHTLTCKEPVTLDASGSSQQDFMYGLAQSALNNAKSLQKMAEHELATALNDVDTTLWEKTLTSLIDQLKDTYIPNPERPLSSLPGTIGSWLDLTATGVRAAHVSAYNGQYVRPSNFAELSPWGTTTAKGDLSNWTRYARHRAGEAPKIPGAVEGLEKVGKVAGVVGAVAEGGINAYNSYQSDTINHPDMGEGEKITRAGVRGVMTGAASWAGATYGAQLGAAIGAAGGPVGIVVGGVVGGIVGGVVASKAGGVFADVFNDYVVSPVAKWFGG